MLYKLAAAVPAGFAVKIIRSTADDTVSMLLVGLVYVKIIFESVKVINLIANGKFINVVFYFAGCNTVCVSHNGGVDADPFFYTQGFCYMLYYFSVLFLNGKHDIVL